MKKELLKSSIGVVLSFIVCLIQYFSWSFWKPLLWFLFYPAVFLSCLIGGKYGGYVSTITSVLLALFFFVPSMKVYEQDTKVWLSMTIFTLTGFSFNYFVQRLKAKEENIRKELEDRVLKRTEELSEREERYRGLVEGFPAIFYIYSSKRGGIYYSSAVEKIFGCTVDYLYQNPFFWNQSIVSEDQRRVAEAVSEYSKSGKFDIEYRVTIQGKVRWFHDRFFRQVIQNDEIIIEGLAMDISDKKQAEAELQRLNLELENRVKERTAQLEATNKELEAFSYSVSHDLRAPLRGIDGWSLALLEDYSDKLDEIAKQYLHRVRSETQRLGDLIDDLLRLSRVTRSEIHFTSVNLSELVRKISLRLKEEFSKRNFEFTIQSNLIIPKGDIHLIEIMLTNLLSNACKFTSKQLIGCIEFGSVLEEGKSVFFVKDNGVGFDMAYSKNLFTAFNRMHKQSEFPGTGIGLATVKRIIYRHSGNIWVEAQKDKGATFYFTFGE